MQKYKKNGKEIPEALSPGKEEEDYQKIIDKLYHPIRDNIVPPKEKKAIAKNKLEADNENNNMSTGGNSEAHVDSQNVPQGMQEREKPTPTEESQKTLSLAARVRNRLKAIAEGLDILVEDDAS